MQTKYFAIQYTDEAGFAMFASRDGNPMIYKDFRTAKTELEVYKAELHELLKGIPHTTRKWFKSIVTYTPLETQEHKLIERVYKTLHISEIPLRPLSTRM